MEYQSKGKIIQGVGGRYTIDLFPTCTQSAPLDGKQVTCRARGAFRHSGETPLPGDDVLICYDERACAEDVQQEGCTEGGGSIRIDRIFPRRNALIRPPMANLDVLFVSMAAARPEPLLSTVDKLISIAEHHHIEPVIIVGKSDLSPQVAQRLNTLYTHAGFVTFTVSCERGEGIDALRDYIKLRLKGGIAAFAGASGVGKSSLLNALFPDSARRTGEISHKNERGKNTTREVTLLPLARLFGTGTGGADGYLADTPGFTLLDFTRFDFFSVEDLPATMRDFAPYLGHCRYGDCTHTKEEECAIRAAVSEGRIEPSRYESFLAMYHDLKDKRPWTKPPVHR